MPRPVADAVASHLDLELRIGGYEAAERAAAALDDVYESAARLINSESDQIAQLENATRAWNAVFYAQRFRPGDRILTGRAEYCSNYMAHLQVTRETGAEIVVVDDDAHGQIDVGQMESLLDERVKLISLTHVPTSGGLVNPAADVGRLARRAGVPFLLDVCQSIGQMPIDVREIGCDFLSATGRKFLRGPRGTGFLFVDRRRLDEVDPPVVEVGAAAWSSRDGYTWKAGARRFETWEVSHALRLGLGRAIEYALALGLETIEERVVELAQMLRDELGRISGANVHDLGRVKCGIVTFTVDGVDSEALRAELYERSVNVDVSTAEDTRLDFEARGLRPMIRASVHYFNTAEEVARFCELVETVSRRPVGVA
jgi:selenocysteine lyase/cysteine desulfurase